MKEFFIDSDGIKLHAKLDRPDETAQGPLCILVHGFTGHMEEPHIVAMQQAMNECEYFAVDIQLDYRTPAYPEAFVEADPPARNGQGLVKGKVETALKRFYRGLTGETLNAGELTFRFLRDESGAREDCWEITGTDLNFVISAY